MTIYIVMGSVVIAVELCVVVFEHGYHVFVVAGLIIPTKRFHKVMREFMRNSGGIEGQWNRVYTT